MQTEQIPVLKADEYPGGIWYYEPHTYQPYRYVLGRVGTHPLVCIGHAASLPEGRQHRLSLIHI